MNYNLLSVNLKNLALICFVTCFIAVLVKLINGRITIIPSSFVKQDTASRFTLPILVTRALNIAVPATVKISVNQSNLRIFCRQY